MSPRCRPLATVLGSALIRVCRPWSIGIGKITNWRRALTLATRDTDVHGERCPTGSEATMNYPLLKLAAKTGSSVVVDSCQSCGSAKLESHLFLGYMPPVNQMRPIGAVPAEQPSYPTSLLYCPRCELVQLGLTVDPEIIFPPSYPYTSGTTRILRDNFAAL